MITNMNANMKSTIHRRVSRNKIDGKERKHVRRDASGAIKKRWTQKALLVSRVMQAFRAECVRERILRDPSSAHLLQRKHYRVLKHGRASKAPVKEEGEEGRCISDAYKQSACGSCGRRVARLAAPAECESPTTHEGEASATQWGRLCTENPMWFLCCLHSPDTTQ